MDKNKKEKIEYISLFEAAKKSGYAQDYLSLLCRQGKLKGEKIGRNWVTTYQWLDEYQQNLISDMVSEKKHITHKKDFEKKERKIKIPELVLATSLFFLILLGGFAYAKNPQFFSNIQDIKKQATIRIIAFKSDLAEQTYQTKDQIAYRLSEIGENISNASENINLALSSEGDNIYCRLQYTKGRFQDTKKKTTIQIVAFKSQIANRTSALQPFGTMEPAVDAGKSIVMFPLKVGEKFGEGIITYPIKIPIKIGDSFDKGFAKNDLVLNSSLGKFGNYSSSMVRQAHHDINKTHHGINNIITLKFDIVTLSLSKGIDKIGLAVQNTFSKTNLAFQNSFNNLSKGASVFFETTDRKTDREKEFGRVAGVSDSIEENTEVKLLQNLRKVSFHNISKSISKVEKFIWETPIRVADESANIVIDGPIKIGETVIAAADKTINQISDAYISAGKSLANGVNPIRNISRDYVSYYSAGISNGVNNFSDKIIGFSNKVAGFFNSGLNNVSKKLANLFGNTYFGLTQLFVEQGGEKISQVQIQIQEGDDTDRRLQERLIKDEGEDTYPRLQNETGTEDEIENLKEGLDILQQEIDELKKVSTGKIIQQNITQEIVREIIKEQKGEQGLAGPQGLTGAAGLQGPVGAGTTIVQGGDAYLSGGNTWIGGNVFESHTLMNSLGVSHKTSIGDDLSVGGTTTLGTTAVDDLNVHASANFFSPLTVTNSITQSSGQVTFGGNVDATSGLDITGANLTVGGTNFVVDVATGDIITSGDLTIAGTTTLGDASTDTIIPNAQFTGDLIPSTTSVYDLGSATNYWDSAYINNIVVGSTNVGGTTSESFILNTDNATADAEDIWMEFERGAAVPNAKILWSSGNTRFDFNFPVHLSGTGALSGPGAGGLTLTNDSGPLTVSTTTSGDLALTSADDLTLSSGGATSINSTGALTLDSATGILTLGAGTNTIINTDADTAILINPNGTGAVQFHSASNYLDASGNLILDGDITLTSGGTFYTTANGDLVFAPNGSGNLVIGETANPAKIIPFADSTVGYDLGEATQRWYDLYLKNSIDIDSTKLDIDSLNFVGLGQITTGASTDLTLQPGTGGKTVITDGTDYVQIADGTRALYAVKGAQAVELADGTWAIDATGDVRLSQDITITGGKIILGSGTESIDNETSNLLKLTTSGDTKVVLGDSAGANQFQIADSDNNVVAYVDSDGNVSAVTGAFSTSIQTPQIQTGSGDLTLAPAGKTTTAQNFETTGTGTITSAGLLTAQDGLTVSGTGNILFSTSGTINQSGSGQITFSGNVDATNGLDITGVTNLGDGGTANYAQFSATGDLTLVGTADTIQKSDGALIIQTVGQNLTVQTTSSGNLALTSADDLILTAGAGNLTLGAGTNTIVNTDAATDLLINPTGKVQFQTSNYWIDGSGNLQMAKVISPELEYAGNITIDATNNSAASTVSVINSDGGQVANLEIEGDVKITGGNLGIGMDPNANAIAVSGDGTIDIYSAAAATTLTITNSDNTYGISLDIADGGLKTSGQSRLTSAGALENITGYTQSSGSFDMSGSAGTFQTGTGAVSLKGNTTIDSGKTLTAITSGQTAASDAVSFGINETGETGSAYNTLVLSRINGAANSYALYVSSGDVLLTGDTYFGTTSYGVTSAGVGTFAGITGTSLDAGSGTIQTTGTADFGATTVDSLDVSSGGITNAGAISGVTTISASGAITAATDETINGIDIDSGAISDITTIVTSGDVTVGGDLTVTGASTNFQNAIKAVDGSGSGIDADLLDGHDTGYFMTAVSDNWVDESGDTMAGTLDMDNNLIVNIGNAGTDFVAGGGLTLAGALTANGTIALGDGGDDIAINSNDWNISSAGAISGATTIGASGAITGGTLTDGSFSVTSGNITGAGNLTFSGSPVVTINDGGTMTWKDSAGSPNTLMTLTDVGSVGDLNISGDATVSGGELYLTGIASSSSTTEGTMYYDTDDDQLKVYANGKWQADRTTATVIVGVNTGVAATSSKNYEKADFVCDGTDDHLEIESAIAALPDNGGLVHLLEGTYNIGASIDIAKSNVTLMGSGNATKLFLANAVNNSVIIVGDGSTAYSNITISDLQIDGNKAGQSSGTPYGIHFYGSSGNLITKSKIQRVYAHDTYNICINLAHSSDNIISENYLSSSWYSGIQLGNSDRNNIVSNQIDSMGGNGIRLYIYNDYNIISNNTVNNNTSDGIHLYAADNNTVTGNISKSNGKEGIANKSSSYNTINSNVIYDNGTGATKYNGITIEGTLAGGNSDYNVISDNSIYANGGATKYQINIIEGTYSHNNQIVDNIVLAGATGAGTINDAGTDTQVSGNYTGTAGEGLFHTEANSSSTALTVTQSGTGNLVDLTGDSITTGTGLSMSVDGLSSGSGIAVDSSSAAISGGKLLNVTANGALGSAETVYGVYSALSGASANNTNVAGYFSATGAGSTNYGLLVPNGYVGIGIAAPTTTLHVAGQCVTADTRLRRRRKKKKGEKADPEKDEWEDSEYIYDEVMIKDIRPGDEIASMDPITGELVYSQVNGLMDMGIKEIYEITTRTGRQIRTTENHPYFVRGRYDDNDALKNTEPKHQKLYKFEVDQSIKIEQYTKDTVISVANGENSSTIIIPKEAKQTLRAFGQKHNASHHIPMILFASSVVVALRKMKAAVHEIIVDTEYVGHEDIITQIIKNAFPDIYINFTQVGKKSPAHHFAYGVHKKEKIADYTATVNEVGQIAENALRMLAHQHIRLTIRHTTRTFLVTNSINDNKKSVKGSSVDNSRLTKSGQWAKVKGLKVGQMIAVVYGDKVVWEKITKIKKQAPERVYDIEVEGTHNFVANDIVAHNTYIDTGSTTALVVEDDGTKDNVLVVDTTNGRIGVGTGTPDNLLSLNEASGDVLLDFDLNDVDKWVMGIDDSDNDYFKINSGNTLADVSNFTFKDNGDLRITGALTVGVASTTYGDNSIESGSTLSVNTTGNQAVSFGTGAFSATATTDINLATANATAADIDIGTSSQANTISIGTTTASSTLELASADWAISATGDLTGIGSFSSDGDLTIGGDATVSGGELYLTGTASSSSTTEGTMYYDTDDDQLKVYANGKWQADRTTATVIVGVNTGVAATSSKNYEKADYVCDGTDDHLEIESAIAALPDNGGLVHLLEGTYNIQASIDITKSNVTLMGSGNATKLFLANGTNTSVIIVGDGSTAYSNITISDLQIDGNKAGQSSGTPYGIHFYGSSGNLITKSKIQRVYAHDTYSTGIKLIYSSDNVISENYLSSTWNCGISIRYSDLNKIISNHIDSVSAFGIYLDIYNDYNVISNNTINNSTQNGIYIYLSDNNTVTGNISKSNGRAGITNMASCYNTINSNVVYDNGTGGTKYNGITIEGTLAGGNSDYNIISDNSVYANGGATKYQINITEGTYSHNNQIVDNIVLAGGTGAGTINDSGTDTQISGNYTGTAGEGLFHTEANSSSTALTVVQSGGGDIVNFFDGENEVFTILDGGNVGIGTDTPSQKLHVAGRLATDDKISEGLVGSWHFDEATSGNAHGETLTDDSGYGNDGTGAGTDGPTWTTGKIGGALDFDGSDDYVKVTHGDSLRVQDFTIELWYYAKGGYGPSLCIDNYYTDQGFGIYAFALNSITLWLGNGTAITTIPLTSLDRSLNTWHHLIVTKSGSDVLSYWNGQQDRDGTFSGDISYNETCWLAIGRGVRGDKTNYSFNGDIDEVRIYSRALTADEIQQQYSAGIWKYGTGGIAYMDGNVGIGDSSPSSLLTVGTSDAFQVDSSGNITVAAGQGLDTSSAAELKIGDTTATTLSIGSTAATIINIGAGGALARAINIGTGTGIDTINIGTDATSADLISIGSAGAGNVAIESAAALTLTGLTGSLINFSNFDVASSGAVTIIPTTNVIPLTITRNVAAASSSLLSVTESNATATGTGLVISQAGTAAKVATFAGPAASGTVNLVEISGTTTGTGLTVTQSGTGYIFDLKDGADSVFTVADNGEIFASATTSGNPYALIADEATTNLVLNPSFEYGTYNENWTAVASAVPSDNETYYHAGTHSMKVVTPNSVADEGVQHAAITVSASTTYIGSAFLKGTGTVKLYLTGNVSGDTTTDTINLTDDWTRYFISKTTNATDANLTLKILTPTQQLATFYIDAVQLEAKSAMTTYCDGSLGEGYSWDSTEHNSSSSRTAGMRFKNNTTGFALNDEGRLDVSGLTVSQKGSADGEIFRVSGGADSILSVNQAIVEINQPLAVNVAGDVGINYDLYFAGTGTSNITSAGPLVIAAGDPNHSENLTITTGGSGDVIVDIVDSTFGFKVLGVQGGYVFRILPSGDLDIHSVASNLNTPFGGFGQYQNLLTYSEELENVAWTKHASITVDANQTDGPDGASNTAEKLTAGADNVYVEQGYDDGDVSTDETYTFSVWLKASSDTVVTLKILTTGTTAVSENRTATIEWQRFYVTGTFGTDAVTTAKGQILIPTNGDIVYAWGAQLEEASDAGVYAYTTSSVVATGTGLLAKDLKLSGDLTSDGTLTAGGSGTSYIYDSLNIGTDTTAGTVDMGAGADADLFVSDDLEIDGNDLVFNNLNIKKFQADSAALSGATVDIEINVPSGATLLAIQFNVQTAITGATTWDADLIDGNATKVADDAALAQNTKVNYNFTPVRTTAETDVQLTANTADFTGGVVRAVVYYYDLINLPDN